MARASPLRRPTCVPRRRMEEILGFLTSLTSVLLLILHSLQIVQILDLVLCLVKSLNGGPLCLDLKVMIVCHHLLR
jgi:hypothetical protein